MNGKKAHSTQKPAELLYRIIISTSNPDEIVLDPFSGSGTTEAVAKRLERKFIAFDREELYVKISTDRIGKIKPLNKPLLEYKIEKRKPKVPFVNLIEKGFIKIGETLYSFDGKFTAQVLTDSTLEGNGIIGSIHKVCAFYLGKENHNGWNYWYVKRNNKLISIDDFRYDYEKKYLNKTDLFKYNELEFETKNNIC